jgi:nitronate monooxygenase
MAGSCTPALAAAVAGTGGLGSLGVGPRSTEFIRERVAALRSATNRPFNLNFFAHTEPQGGATEFEASRAALKHDYAALDLGDPPQIPVSGSPGFGADQLSLLLELRPAVASFHFGLPGDTAIAALREAGIIFGATATTVAEAIAVEAGGCDFVVAQGFEAGGHRGAHENTGPDHRIRTLALVPQVVDAVAIPVVAAGGIGDARGIVAALALGAAGVQMGTAFLRCPEAETDTPRRARLARATDTDTIVTSVISGRANRVAVGHWAQRLSSVAASHMPYPLQYALTGPLLEAGGEDYAAHQYGQAASLALEMPAGELVRALVSETAERLSALTV